MDKRKRHSKDLTALKENLSLLTEARLVLFPALRAKDVSTTLKVLPQAVRWLKAFCQKDEPPAGRSNCQSERSVTPPASMAI
ncbi:MAG: hypothetical protein ACJAQT_003513 [Akkermansiaceae bacterium]|jgi:hypothetical protein